ncbi:MAG: transketolase [Bacteroidales bacterium]|jgi:transketolase|nr:transketolase [Bacteroidales bacterium]MDD4213549.1 transketolase [Bacteroidales bacterium]
MRTVDELKKIATQVRRDLLRMIHAVNSGHPGGSLGCSDLLTCLYFSVMEHIPQPFSMEGRNEDVFFLSNGHLSAAWYSVLARSGYFEIKDLATFRKLNSSLQGHPTTAEKTKGVRVASGSLGQGMSVAIGMAIAKKLEKDNHIVYCLHGDGEIQEGQIWEAIMFASAKKIDNIISIIDYNGRQIEGNTDDVLSLGDIKAKFTAFGWKVFEMNGNDISEILDMLIIAKANTFKGVPVVIIMKTEMGYGVDFMMGTHKWHGIAPNDEQLKLALAQLPETLGDY